MGGLSYAKFKRFIHFFRHTIRLRIGVPFVFLVYWEFFFYYKEGFDFIKFFCVSIEMIIWFSTFSVNAMNYVTLLSFRMLNQLCNFGDTSIGLDVLLLFFLILFFFFELLVFLLGFLMYIHGRHWPVIFHFECPSQIAKKVILPQKWTRKYSFFLY